MAKENSFTSALTRRCKIKEVESFTVWETKVEIARCLEVSILDLMLPLYPVNLGSLLGIYGFYKHCLK